MRYASALGKNITVGLVLWVAIWFVPNKSLAYYFPGWYHGASGHYIALREAIDEEKPLIVYFHTDTCKWSKRLNSDYLATSKVYQFLSDISRVEINPEKGALEKDLSEKYGVKGFPSFFAYVPALGRSAGERIHPFRKDNNWSVDEFIDAISKKLGNQYIHKGHSCFTKKKYIEAIRYFEMAINYTPEDPYAYYGIGMAYNNLAYEKKETELLKKAQSYYSKALSIDPNHKGSKEELERLKKAIEKLAKR
jgi:tetratricopeptide (TPR) repeat protein